MVIGQLILKLGVQAENLDALRQFESGADKGAAAATGAAKGTGILETALIKAKGALSGGYGIVNALRSAHTQMLRFRSITLLVIATLTGLSKIGGMVALSLTRFQLNTGLSAQRLQEWQQQAALSGIAADEMTESVIGLQRAQAEIAMGAGNVTPFAMLGLNPQEDPFVILDKLKSRLASMSPAKGTLFASQMGLSDNMIAFLREGKRPGSDKALLLSKEEIVRLREFNMYFNRVWDNIKRSAQKAGAVLTPLATSVMWVVDRFRKAFSDLADLFSKWGDKAEGLQKYKIFFTIFFGSLLAAMFPVAAAAAVIALAIEDILSFNRGDNSVTGAVLGWWHDLSRVIWDAIGAMITFVKVAEEVPGNPLWLARSLQKAVTKKGEPMPKSAGEKLEELVMDVAATQGFKYNDIVTARKNKAGEIVYGPPPTVNNNITVNKDGSVDVKTVYKDAKTQYDISQKAVKKALNGATYQSPVPEGSGQ